MCPDKIDWRTGQVDFWGLDFFDPGRSCREQLGGLKEDLVQVSFPGDKLIDVGWYPEFSAEGAFKIFVVQNKNWEQPLREYVCKTGEELLLTLRTAITFVVKAGLTADP
jgi:hypothetical protein